MILLYQQWSIPWGSMGNGAVLGGGGGGSADPDQWVRKFGLAKGKWRVRTPRIAGSDSIVEKGQSTQDLE